MIENGVSSVSTPTYAHSSESKDLWNKFRNQRFEKVLYVIESMSKFRMDMEYQIYLSLILTKSNHYALIVSSIKGASVPITMLKNNERNKLEDAIDAQLSKSHPQLVDAHLYETHSSETFTPQDSNGHIEDASETVHFNVKATLK